MTHISYMLERQVRYLENANGLPQGSVVGAYEDGEFRFYKFGVLAGRVPKYWTTSIIHTWSKDSLEEGTHNGLN